MILTASAAYSFSSGYRCFKSRGMLVKQLTQTFCSPLPLGLGCPGIVVRTSFNLFPEQSPHTTHPQWRQCCLRHIIPNAALHSIHAAASLSATQRGLARAIAAASLTASGSGSGSPASGSAAEEESAEEAAAAEEEVAEGEAAEEENAEERAAEEGEAAVQEGEGEERKEKAGNRDIPEQSATEIKGGESGRQ